MAGTLPSPSLCRCPKLECVRVKDGHAHQPGLELSSGRSCALSTNCVISSFSVRSLGTVPPAEADVKMKGDKVESSPLNSPWWAVSADTTTPTTIVTITAMAAMVMDRHQLSSACSSLPSSFSLPDSQPQAQVPH